MIGCVIKMITLSEIVQAKRKISKVVNKTPFAYAPNWRLNLICIKNNIILQFVTRSSVKCGNKNQNSYHKSYKEIDSMF